MRKPQKRGVAGGVAPVLACVLLSCLAGCGADGIDTAQLERDWESYPSEHFVLYFPLNSPRLSRMAEFAATCEEISTHVCRVLQVTPDQPIRLFMFNSDAQCDSLLGREAGFVDNGKIVMRIGQHPGGYIARAICRLIDRKATRLPLLEAGMFQLYAQPEVNVHAETFGFERQNRFVPLGDLADTTIEKDPAVYSAEAASFCAFLLANYGPERFKSLWSSPEGLAESITKIYGAELGNFEQEWRKYYRRETGRT